MTSDLGAAAADVVEAGRALADAGLSPGTTGNVSVRVADSIVCTPTGATLGSLDPEGLSVIDLDGRHRSGPVPTKETFMHRAMYRADDAVTAIVHTHARHATAVSCLDGLDPFDAITSLTPYLVMKGGPVALVPFCAPGDPALIDLIGAAVKRGHRTLLLANHGTLAGTTGLDGAVTVTIELEEAAAIQLLTADRAVRPLTDTEIQHLRDTYPFR